MAPFKNNYSDRKKMARNNNDNVTVVVVELVRRPIEFNLERFILNVDKRYS